MSTRRDLLAQQTRAELIEIATRQFTRHGFAEVSIDTIRGKIGLSRGGFYHHFPDKEACFEAVFVALQEEWLDGGSPDDPGAGPWGIVAGQISRFLDQCLEPAYRRICLQDAPGALGWQRWRSLQDRYGLAFVEAALQQVGKKHDLVTVRMTSAGLVEAALHLAGHRDPAAVRPSVQESILNLIRGVPDDPQAATAPGGRVEAESDGKVEIGAFSYEDALPD